MTEMARSLDRAPWAVRTFDPILMWLLRKGVPLGPNTLLTVVGRKSGVPRTSAVALVQIDGRLWIQSAYGEVNWVRNLRQAREAAIRIRGKDVRVDARELSLRDAEAFYRDTLLPYVARQPVAIRHLGQVFVREIMADPAAAARRRQVFELTPKNQPAAGHSQRDLDRVSPGDC